MQCPRCQQDNPSHAKFCLECGASVIGAAPIAARYADQKAEIETLRRSLTEADEQHAATSEILKLIARSPTDVRPVFDTLAERAMRLCDAKFSLICLYDGELLHVAVLHNVSPAHAAAMREAFPMPPDRGGAAARAVLTRAVVHIPDVLADPEYRLRRLGETTNARNAMTPTLNTCDSAPADPCGSGKGQCGKEAIPGRWLLGAGRLAQDRTESVLPVQRHEAPAQHPGSARTRDPNRPPSGVRLERMCGTSYGHS